MTMDEWRYDNQDLEHLSMIMALHDMGFTSLEVERINVYVEGVKDIG